MAVVGITLMILLILSLFSVILGNGLIDATTNVAVDNSALIDGIPSTFVIEGVDVVFSIDTSSLINAGIALIITIIVVAGITGIQVLGSGLSPSSVRVIILGTSYAGIWAVLSILAFNLIITIELFGTIIYITLTIAYAIGVINKISISN